MLIINSEGVFHKTKSKFQNFLQILWGIFDTKQGTGGFVLHRYDTLLNSKIGQSTETMSIYRKKEQYVIY